MKRSLNDVIYSREPSGLIEPIELDQSDLGGVEMVPLCLLGIFNPMGPTLVALNVIIRDNAPSGAILYTSLNPFNQTRLITAKVPSDPEGLFNMFGDLYRVGDGCILNGLPDFVIPSMKNQGFAEGITDMLYALVATTPLRNPLSKINQDYRSHWQDPWNRIPSMEEMVRQAISGQKQQSVAKVPEDEEFIEWIKIMTDVKHTGAEIGAIIKAWDGSIQMAGGMPHMSLKEVADELDALGYPYLNQFA